MHSIVTTTIRPNYGLINTFGHSSHPGRRSTRVPLRARNFCPAAEEISLRSFAMIQTGAVIRRRVVAHGLVQGVFFRDTCRRQASAHRVSGWVTNREDGAVEA